MFSTAGSTTGNSLFQLGNTTNSQNPQPQQQPQSTFQFGQGTPSAGAGSTGSSGMFKYGASTATPGTSAFNFGSGTTISELYR